MMKDSLNIAVAGATGYVGLELIKILSRNLSSFQSGYLYHYAFVMLASLVIFLTWYIFN